MAHATVLIVDDEDLIRWSLRERLRGDGYDILEAGTGQAALEQFKEGVDLVLLAYRLPDMDGISILRELKKLDPDVPGLQAKLLRPKRLTGAALHLTS
jgi:CheY-like chemotaxis protein